jgi:hypothetical protein
MRGFLLHALLPVLLLAEPPSFLTALCRRVPRPHSLNPARESSAACLERPAIGRVFHVALSRMVISAALPSAH